jgi:hypothetical protein
MAGRRRGTGRSTQAQARNDRRRRLLVTRLGKAQGPNQQLAVAYSYAMAVLASLPATTAEALACELVDTLLRAADHAARPATTTRRAQR